MAISSLRLRLLGLAVITIVVTLAVAGTSLTVLFERQLLRRVTQELEIRWTELATVFGSSTRDTRKIGQMLADSRYRQPYSGAYWQISENGQPLQRSRSLWDGVIDTRAVDPTVTKGNVVQAVGPNGSKLYVIERAVTLDGISGPRALLLAVGLDHSEVYALRQAFGWDVARVLGLIALVLTAATWLQLTLGLRPLRTLDRELKAVRDGQLQRLRSRFPDEIAPLAENLNRLLDRQEQLVRKARDRAGSLAHGLKTPLTILGAEVRRIEAQGQRKAARRLSEQLAAIRRHVDRELARSRTSGAAAAVGAFTAVDDSVGKLLRLMQLMPRGDMIAWWSDIPADLRLCMEPDDFGEVLGNLLDNSRKSARTTVAVRAEMSGERACIVIEDDGPGFSGDPDSLAIERVASGHTNDTPSGLGLTIVHDVLAEYQTKLIVTNTEGGCRASFEIDVCRPDAAHSEYVIQQKDERGPRSVPAARQPAEA
jgi:signal transduction histidine kinase